MIKMNCWEFQKCGRETGGRKVAELGICPSAIETKLNGINRGIMAGRACWAVAGTLCNGKVQGTFALKLENCLKCEFYRLVCQEEGHYFQEGKAIWDKLFRF